MYCTKMETQHIFHFTIWDAVGSVAECTCQDLEKSCSLQGASVVSPTQQKRP